MPSSHPGSQVRIHARVALLAMTALLAGACASVATPPASTPSAAAPSAAASGPPPSGAAPSVPAETPSPTIDERPSVTPPASAPASGPPAAIVTFRFQDGSEYRVELVKPEDIRIARELLAGTHSPMIPNGRVVRGTSVNTGWSWHIDPYDFEWAEMTAEVCDGLPKYVQDGTLTSDRFCPWNAKVVAVEPVR